MTVSAAEYRARKTSKIDLAPRTIPGGTLTEIDTLVVQLRDAGLPVGAGIEKSLAIRNATMGVARLVMMTTMNAATMVRPRATNISYLLRG